MPNRDGTGRSGKGARTGRGLGNCPPESDKDRKERERGLGMGNGRGRGRGLNK